MVYNGSCPLLENMHSMPVRNHLLGVGFSMMLVERIGTDSMLIDILKTIFPNEDFIIIPNRH